MNFLEAHKILKTFQGGEDLKFSLCMSGLSEKLDIFLKAYAAQEGYDLKYRALPFNTLQQYIYSESVANELEIFVLFPWDFVPSADWRSGFPEKSPNEDACYGQVKSFIEQLGSRKQHKIIYVPATMPPLFSSLTKLKKLELYLLEAMKAYGADILPSNAFSISSYLDNGCPFAGKDMNITADAIIKQAIPVSMQTKKVLVTDLDNVMWHGVIGEDGIDGIQFESQGLGYRYFIYQTYLRKLKSEGVLIAAVSRNDDALAKMPFLQKNMKIKSDDLVSIIASYNAKSSQIKELASQLNLGLDSFVFVDDNPIEIEEVSRQLPMVSCILFPSKDQEMMSFYEKISSYFDRDELTEEDMKRTELYRRRLKSFVPSDKSGSDLTSYLKDLEMELHIYDRTFTDKSRAVQLINKTNQFNLNGIRITDEQIDSILEDGGKIITAALSDKHGDHGEIISCLVTSEGIIKSYVMSCRVFQRRIEYAFLFWLISRHQYPALSFEYIETERNEPFGKFLQDDAFSNDNSKLISLSVAIFIEKHKSDYTLFKVTSDTKQPA